MDVLKWKDKVELAVLKYARHQPHDVKEDMRQECLVALMDASTKFTGLTDDDARQLAYTIAKTTVFDMLDKITHRKKIEASDVDTPEVAAVPEPAFNAHTALATGDLHRAVEKLPPIEQLVVSAVYFEGKTDAEVAHDLGRSRDWVKRTKQSALAKLRTLLNKEK